MKRHAIAADVGSSFAIPAAADSETGLKLGERETGAGAQVRRSGNQP